MKNPDKLYLGLVTLLGIVLVGLALATDQIDKPAAWLDEWTTWAAKYVGLAIAAQSLWKVGDALAVRLAGRTG